MQKTQLSNASFFETKPCKIAVTPKFDSGKKFRCMYCTLTIDGIPMGCPVEGVTKRIASENKHSDEEFCFEFVTFGIFCSFNCAKAYALEHTHDPKFRHSSKYLAMMFSHSKYQRVNIPVTIERAPSPLLMSCFGGFMTDDQYKKQRDSGKYEFDGLTTMFPLSYVFQKKD